MVSILQHETSKYVPYECEKCSEKFFAYKDFKRHAAEHMRSVQDDHVVTMTNKLHLCAICAREFTSKAMLTKHWNNEHTRIPGDRDNKTRHLKIGSSSSSCTLVEFNGNDRSRGDVPHKVYDQYGENSNTDMDQSLLKTYEERGRFSCPACQREFLHRANLQAHVEKYSNKKVYKCSYCEKQFHFRTSWKRHEECHRTDRRVWECDTCTLTFTQKVSLKRHKECNKNPCSENKYMRTYGNRTTQRGRFKPTAPSSLVSFVMSDEEEEEEDEEDEDQELKRDNQPPENTTTSIDNTHIQKGEALYSCSYCGKLFNYRSLWTRHEKEHLTSKNFICNYCGTKFTRQYYLTRHRKTCLSKIQHQSSASQGMHNMRNSHIIL